MSAPVFFANPLLLGLLESGVLGLPEALVVWLARVHSPFHGAVGFHFAIEFPRGAPPSRAQTSRALDLLRLGGGDLRLLQPRLLLRHRGPGSRSRAHVEPSRALAHALQPRLPLRAGHLRRHPRRDHPERAGAGIPRPAPAARVGAVRSRGGFPAAPRPVHLAVRGRGPAALREPASLLAPRVRRERRPALPGRRPGDPGLRDRQASRVRHRDRHPPRLAPPAGQERPPGGALRARGPARGEPPRQPAPHAGPDPLPAPWTVPAHRGQRAQPALPRTAHAVDRRALLPGRLPARAGARLAHRGHPHARLPARPLTDGQRKAGRGPPSGEGVRGLSEPRSAAN